MEHSQATTIMGPRDRRQRELEDRRNLILEKSRELFFEKGFDSVTIQDICDAVEYGRSAIYSMFESKEEIYSYIFLDALHIIKNLNQSINPNGDFDTEIMKTGENVYKFYAEYTDHFKAISFFNNKSIEKSKIPQKFFDKKDKLSLKATSTIAQLLKNNIRNGKIKKIDTESIIGVFYSALIGIIGLFIHTEEDEDKIYQSVMLHTELYKDGLKLKV